MRTDTSGFARIVVPLDGSPSSETALPVAKAIAEASHGSLFLARVHTPVAITPDVGYPLPDWEDDIRLAECAYLADTARPLVADAHLPTETRLLEGSVGSAVKKYVEDVSADLIIASTHGRTGLSRAWLGSTVDWLVRFAPVPVLLMRPSADAPQPIAWACANILVTLDGSERAEKVLPDALRLARTTGARITLLRVVMPAVHSIAPYGIAALAVVPDEPRTFDLMHEAKHDVEELASALRRDNAGLEFLPEVVLGEHVAETILEEARTRGADVLALCSRGRGASRLLVGSIADKLLRGFSGALMMLGPAALQELALDTIVNEDEPAVLVPPAVGRWASSNT